MTPLRLDDDPKPFLKRLVVHRILPLTGVFGVIIAVTWFIKHDYIGKWSTSAVDYAIETSADAGFRVDQIYVRGRNRTDKDTLLSVINIRKGDPIFITDPDMAAGLLEKLHWVKQANVTRRLPDQIHIDLVEHQPLALYQHKQKLHVIDESGNIIPDQDVSQFSNLPMVIGPSANDRAASLFSMLAAEPNIWSQVDHANWIGGRRWNIHLKNGVTIKLPENDAGLALARYATLSAQPQFQADQIGSVDLRYSDRAVITQRNSTIDPQMEPHQSGASS